MSDRVKIIFISAGALIGILIVFAAAKIVISVNRYVETMSSEAEAFIEERQAAVSSIEAAAAEISSMRAAQEAAIAYADQINAITEELDQQVNDLSSVLSGGSAASAKDGPKDKNEKKADAEDEAATERFFGLTMAAKIAAVNRKTFEDPKAGLTDVLTKRDYTLKDVYDLITAYTLPAKPYYEMTPAGDTLKNDIAAMRNLMPIEAAIAAYGEDAEAPIEFGILLHGTNVRSFPTDFRATDAGDGTGFDFFQETMLPACSGVLILHHTHDGRWAFAVGADYCGWIHDSDIAYCRDPETGEPSEDMFLSYLQPEHFVVSLTHADGSDIFRLGEIIPYREKTEDGYILLLPSVDENGCMKSVPTLYPDSEDCPDPEDCFSDGFLAWDPARLIDLAEDLTDVPYGWGDTGGVYDCSSFTGLLYRCFGFFMPRNTSALPAFGGSTVDVADYSDEEKLELLTGHASAVLTWPGHAMLYTGDKKHPGRILHESYSVYVKTDASEEMTLIMNNRAVESDASEIYRVNGESFLSSVQNVIYYDEGETEEVDEAP